MKDAKSAILGHHEAINKQDSEEYLATIKFPFTYQNFNGVALTAETEQDYKDRLEMPWEIIKRTEKKWRKGERRRRGQYFLYRFVAQADRKCPRETCWFVTAEWRSIQRRF